jgi:hypothetical protein
MSLDLPVSVTAGTVAGPVRTGGEDRDMSVSVGDRVSWNTPQGRTQGKVVEKKTKDFKLAGHEFTASDDEPMFVVESEKSGSKAAHKPSALNVLKS